MKINKSIAALLASVSFVVSHVSANEAACSAAENIAPSGELVATRIPVATTNTRGLYEGPVWLEGSVYFSHFTFTEGFPSRILQFTPPDSLKTFVEDSGSNGLTLDAAGNLLAGTHKYKAVSRFSALTGERESVVEMFNGNVFNSPNDLVVTQAGVLYFTDPAFQKSAAVGGQPLTRVYRVENNVVTVLDDSIENPNGITLSPDESTLYVSGGGEDGFVRAYNITKKTPSKGRDLVTPVVIPDGMTVDCLGNIYISEHVLGRIRVVSSKGDALATISVDSNVTNMVFGGANLRTLYITGAGALWSLPMSVAGIAKH